MQAKITYQFNGKIWRHGAEGGWHFVSLPINLSKEIRDNLQWLEEGWGRLKASARIDNHEWQTAIWFDKKHNTYLLPVKADVRKKLRLKEADEITVQVVL